MDIPQEEFYNTKDYSHLLPHVRDILNRRRDHDPDPELLALELDCAVLAIESVLEALCTNDGEFLS